MGRGGGEKGILYDKWGLRVRQKVFFHPKRVASLFLYHFKSYLEPMLAYLDKLVIPQSSQLGSLGHTQGPFYQV